VTNITDNFFYLYATTDNFIGDLGRRVVDFPRMVGPKTLFGQGACLIRNRLPKTTLVSAHCLAMVS
jgi:hypothetical protein